MRLFIRVWFVILNCTLLSGCGLLLSALMPENQQSVPVNTVTLASIEALIQKQPSQSSYTLKFENSESSLTRKQIEKLSEWMRKPHNDLVITVGPVRNSNLIQAIATSRARGIKILRLFNTFNLNASIRYSPELEINSVEVSGWL